jgi:hypothetical protein
MPERPEKEITRRGFMTKFGWLKPPVSERPDLLKNDTV